MIVYILSHYFNFVNKNITTGKSRVPLLYIFYKPKQKEDLQQALNIFSISQKNPLVKTQFYFLNKVLPIAQKII